MGFIYSLRNKKTNKSYIGQTINQPDRRHKRHLSDMRANKHPNAHLQNTFNKYGEETFEFFILCEIENILLDKYEKIYIQLFNCLDDSFGYNIAEGGAGVVSESSRIKNKKTHESKWPNILKIELNTKNIIETYPSMQEAARIEGVPVSNIFKSCKDKGRVVRGYHYIRECDFTKNWKPYIDKKSQPVCTIDSNYKITAIYDKRRTAEEETGRSKQRIKTLVATQEVTTIKGKKLRFVGLTHEEYYHYSVGTCIDYPRLEE